MQIVGAQYAKSRAISKGTPKGLPNARKWASGFTLVETVVSLGLVVMVITTIVLVILAVARQEREDEETMAAQELLIAVASDLRLSLARTDLANIVKSSQFQFAPLPLAGRLELGRVTRGYLRADWKVATADEKSTPGLAVYELQMHAIQVPPADSLLPVRVRLELWPTVGEKKAKPLASLPVDFPPP